VKFLVMTFIFAFTTTALCWTPRDKLLYNRRHFIELAHLLVMQKKASLAKKIMEQEKDLSGCRDLRRGSSDLESLLSCASFINRENDLGMKSPKRFSLIADINILCARYVSKPNKLVRIIESKVFGSRTWAKCAEFTWQQVYLTVYANFDAAPASSLGLLRQAQASLGPYSFWAKKTQALFDSKVQ
jgi:hypothetical protein